MTNTNSPTCLMPISHSESASNDTNLRLQLFGQQEWPEQIVIEPSRLNIGIWGFEEGDISEAYCADTFPKIKVFLHSGQLFTNTGGTDDWVSCYPLIPSEEYNGGGKKPYSYEGESVTYKRKAFKLGPKIKFVSRERTVEEEIDLMRRQYAYGGCFAFGKTYRELLLEFLDSDRLTQGLETAIKQELEQAGSPNTQAEMVARLETTKPPEISNDSSDFSQPTLPGF